MKRIAILLITWLMAISNQAQQTISLHEAIEQGLQRNESIRAAGLEVDFQRQRRKQGSDAGKMSIKYVRGQINSYLRNDNTIQFEQNVPFPTVFVAENQLSDAQIRAAAYGKEIAENELVFNIKRAYYEQLYLKAREELLMRQDSVYGDFVVAATERYRKGETSLLEKATAETQQNEIDNQLAVTEGQIVANRRLLQTLLNSDLEVWITGRLEERELELGPATIAVNSNPALAFTRQQVEIDVREKKLASARLLPDINLGFFSQTLLGSPADGSGRFATSVDRFTGYQVGLSIPIWLKPHIARVRAAEVSRQRDEALYDYGRQMLEGEWEQAVQEYLRNKSSVEYYESSALANAELILEQSTAAYNNDEIDYPEYWLALQHAIGIRQNYLDAMNDVNQSVIRLEYLVGVR